MNPRSTPPAQITLEKGRGLFSQHLVIGAAGDNGIDAFESAVLFGPAIFFENVLNPDQFAAVVRDVKANGIHRGGLWKPIAASPPIAEVADLPHRRVCTLDDVVYLEGGGLYDLSARHDCEPADLVMTLTTYNLLADDILRLSRLLKGYPEISADEYLRAFLAAGVAHLEALRSRFSDVGFLLAKYATITRWRSL